MATLSQQRVASLATRWLTEELQAMAKIGNWEGAMAAFRRMSASTALRPNVYHYTTVINACGRAGQLNAALALFAEMKVRHVKANVYTYTALINACGNAVQPDLALRTFAEMRLAEVPPNVRTITALVAACSKAGLWERAVKVLADAEEHFVAPNVFTYTAAMDGCRRAGVCLPAVQLLAQMHDPNVVRPNEVTYNTVIGACAAAKDYQRALRVFALMVADGYSPIPYTRELLVQLFVNTPLAGMADDLSVREKPTRRQAHLPDSDPATALRAEMSDASSDVQPENEST